MTSMNAYKRRNSMRRPLVLLGFVAACDLYPVQTDPTVAGSNEGEIFYARTVTDTSSTRWTSGRTS